MTRPRPASPNAAACSFIYPVLELQWHQTTSHTEAFVSSLSTQPGESLILPLKCFSGLHVHMMPLGIWLKWRFCFHPSIGLGWSLRFCSAPLTSSQVMLMLLQTHGDKPQKHYSVSPPSLQNPSPVKPIGTKLPLSQLYSLCMGCTEHLLHLTLYCNSLVTCLPF